MGVRQPQGARSQGTQRDVVAGGAFPAAVLVAADELQAGPAGELGRGEGDPEQAEAEAAGRTLVVADLSPFTLHYGFDDWDPATITERDAQGLGLGLSGVTLTPADLAGRASLQFVRRYQDGSWEPAARHDVTLGSPGPATLRLSAGHAGRLAAGG